MNKIEQQENKEKALLSVKKAQGTINKVLGMIVGEKYCPDIIQQIDAVMGLLTSSKKTLLKRHLNHCLENNTKENKLKAIEELVKILDLT
jgi:DNA-binding FrmR family transcriptional regulator